MIQSIFQSIKITLKIFCEPLFVSINRNWFSINRNLWIRFLKNQIWLVQNTFSKTFQISFSLSDSARLHKEFFVVFLQISCKVSLSLSQYVYITLPFALFFSFSCIISWFLGNFQTMLYLGFLINQALFYEFDQFGNLWKIKNSRACIEPELGILFKLVSIDETGLLNWCNWSLF